MRQKLTKVISVLLTATILYANSVAVISYAADQFLSEQEIENQKTSTQSENVEFDVYYDGGKHSAKIDINNTETKLNIALKVKNAGYLKNAVVDLSNSNFKIAQIGESSNIQTFDAEGKKITFNKINNGSNILESIKIAADKKDEITEEIFKKDNIIKLTAKYVNEKAEEIAIEKDIIIHTTWKAEDAKAVLNYEITKYIPYAINNVNKLITQGKVTSYIENSILPIKETKINIVAPKINEEYPEKVIVIANTTSATNGDLEGEKFTTDNWQYNNQTGAITINVKNEAIDGKIKWTKNTKDEFFVTYIYSSKVYDAIKDKKVRVTYSANSELNLYGNGITQLTAKIEGYKDETETVGQIVEVITETTQNLNKGYLYNNKNSLDENKKETEYAIKYTANISYAEIIDKLILKQANDNFVKSNAEEKLVNSYNKTLKISKQEFDRIFGTEGEIKILNASGEILETINQKTQVDGKNITLDLSKYNQSNITIQTSKPIKEGNISFLIIKSIPKNLEYRTEEIKDFENIKTSIVATAKNGNIDIAKTEQNNTIQLEEPTQKVEITTNNDRLSTIIKNENVELKVTLENDSIDDMMYKNPTIKIDLPSNIETLNLKDTQIFFDEELKIENTKIIDNANGTKSIIATIAGTQTKYNNSAAKGATIVFTTDITLNKLTPTTDNEIVVIVTNSDNTKTTNKTSVKYVAPTGIVTTNSMVGHNGDEILETINGEPKEALIPTKEPEKEVTFTMNVINNYENTIDNVVILGRIPFTGNKDVETKQDLGSTMDMPLTGAITVNGIDNSNVTIYYSENGDATKDLTNSSNGWTKEIQDYSKIKSYMIVLENHTMNTGTMLAFSYKALIPANLNYEKSAYENYAVYFNNNKASGTIQDKTSAVKIGVTTGTVAKLEGQLTSKIPDGETIKGGTNLEYTLKVKNTGSKRAENVVATLPLPNNTSYIPEKDAPEGSYTIEINEEGKSLLKLNLGTIEPRSNTEKVIALSTMVTALAENKIEMQATITGDNLDSITTNKITNIVSKTYFIKKVETSVEDHKCIMEGYTYLYTMTLKSSDAYKTNTSEKITRENTTIIVTLPEELTYDSIQLLQYSSEISDFADISTTAKVSTDGQKVTVNIGSLDGNYGKTLTIKAKIGKLPEGTYQKDVTTTATIQADGTDVEKLEDVTDTINKPGIKLTQTSNIPESTIITAGEDFTYTFTIENLSDTILEDIIFIDELPKEVKFKFAEVTYPEGTITKYKTVNEEGNPTIKIKLNQKETITIKIKATAKSINSDTNIINKANISNEYVKTESNKISHTIKKFDNTDINIGEESKTKKIIGTVWIDSNKDGIKDVEETKMPEVTVLLLDNNTGDIALDETGNQSITKTTSAGTYMFNYLKPGKYTVIFLYDSANYSATTYQKEGVDLSKNSDAIDKDVIYEGIKRIGAVTEEIIISEENKYDIDLGLVENAKFDLKLDKIVSSITVNNGKNVQKHEYNKNLAKIDIEAKYANTATMVIEYKFTITNEGAIPGYVRKVADYLPQEFKFSTELNKDWYEEKDRTICNMSLANTLINPGESKELTLLLTKNMTEESFGLVTNTAEIYEFSNNYGIQDMDSMPGNKATNEDDISTADVLTTVKTGQIMIYTTLILTVITIIGVGIYLIKKKVIK